MPNRSCFFVLVCMIVLGGCASVRTIDLATATDDAFYELNARAQRRSARLTLAGYPPMTALDVAVTVDTTSWRDPRTGRLRSVPTAQVAEIRLKKNRLWKGALVGAAFGVGVALAAGEGCGGRPEDEGCISRGDLVPAGVLIGGILGGVFGSSGEEKYRFETRAGRPPAETRDAR